MPTQAIEEVVRLRAANEIRQKEWDSENKVTLTYRGNELAGEVGEACNVIKKIERERIGIRGTRATKEQLAEELADVVICADLVAMHEGIDLEQAIVNKFNLTSEKYGLKTRMKPTTLYSQGRVAGVEECIKYFKTRAVNSKAMAERQSVSIEASAAHRNDVHIFEFTVNELLKLKRTMSS